MPGEAPSFPQCIVVTYGFDGTNVFFDDAYRAEMRAYPSVDVTAPLADVTGFFAEVRDASDAPLWRFPFGAAFLPYAESIQPDGTFCQVEEPFPWNFSAAFPADIPDADRFAIVGPPIGQPGGGLEDLLTHPVPVV